MTNRITEQKICEILDNTVLATHGDLALCYIHSWSKRGYYVINTRLNKVVECEFNMRDACRQFNGLVRNLKGDL